MSGIGAVLLAAGAGQRFAGGDKLMMRIGRRPVCVSAGEAANIAGIGHRWAVVRRMSSPRAAALARDGWTPLPNGLADKGQSTSLSLAAKTARRLGLKGLLVLLGDMPNTTRRHMRAILAAAQGRYAVMSEAGGVLMPPAFFPSTVFRQLERVTGDRGARRVFETMSLRKTVSFSGEEAFDVDTRADLASLTTKSGANYG